MSQLNSSVRTSYSVASFFTLVVNARDFTECDELKARIEEEGLVEIFNDELYLTAGEQALLVLACGVDEPPPSRVEDFASWLIAPISDALPALRHGARMALAGKHPANTPSPARLGH